MAMTERHPRPDPEPPEHGHEHERLEALREAAIEVELETGRREETVEEAKRSLLRRLVTLVAGTFVLCLGLALFVLPGPGLVVTAAGLAILSTEVPFAARLLHKVRERLPEDADGNLNPWLLYGSLAVMVVSVGGSIWWYFIR